jgi:hypothetical protein
MEDVATLSPDEMLLTFSHTEDFIAIAFFSGDI